MMAVLYYFVQLNDFIDLLELCSNILTSFLIVWRVDHQPWVLERSMKPFSNIVPVDVDSAIVEDNTQTRDLQWMGKLLDKHCRDEQRYLDFDITLEKLSEQLVTNRTYLSRYLASQGLNFREYINGLRVKHACRLMDESEGHIVLKDVANRSGFRYLSTFRRVFKEQTGILPSDYKSKRL